MNAVAPSGRIRVTTTPEGEAPRWARDAWVGVELPALPYIIYANNTETGVISGEKVRLDTSGYVVPQKEALMALAVTQPGAAAWWWAQGYPHTEEGKDHFFFKAADCEIVSGVDPKIKPMMVADDMEMGFFEFPGR